jgi:NAD(P)-dependent dehydrogenase (short-subunit alcohol dehydrogenase family)
LLTGKTGRRRDLGEALQAELEGEDGRCIFIEADHSKLEDCVGSVQKTVEKFGKVDILFNNAGKGGRTKEEGWEEDGAEEGKGRKGRRMEGRWRGNFGERDFF